MCSVLLAACALLAPDPEQLAMSPAPALPVEGYYSCTGRSTQGPYSCVVSVSRRGDVLRVVWADPDQPASGVAVLDDRDCPARLVVGWTSAATLPDGQRVTITGVGSYRPEGAAAWSGVWSAQGGDSGWERWTWLRGLEAPPGPGL